MGPIVFKEKSHKYGDLGSINYYRKNGAKIYSVDINNLKTLRLNEFKTPTKSGDLILIDIYTAHASDMNLKKNKIKYSAKVRFHVLKKVC